MLGKKEKYQIHIFLPEIGRTTINISDLSLYDFSKRQLQSYIIDNGPLNDSNDFVGILVEDKQLNKLIKSSIETAEKYSREFFIKDKKLVLKRKLTIGTVLEKITPYENKILINFTVPKASTLSYLKNCARNQYAKYHMMFYDFILFPLFSLYTLKSNFSLIHGALIRVKNKTIILSGLDGVGKSSLAIKLAGHGCQLLADNFVLFNGYNAFGLNLPIRFSPSEIIHFPIVYKDNQLMECISGSHANHSLKVDLVAILTISKQLNIQKIKNGHNDYFITLMSAAAPEINAANNHCSIFHLINLINNTSGFNTYYNKQPFIEYYKLEIPEGKLAKGAEKLLCELDTL